MRMVQDIVKNLPRDAPYEAIKARLLQTHELTVYQRVEKILAMPALGSRKPSQLLAAMLELCPEGHTTSPFFTALFMQRLPREIRILLTEQDMEDLQALAAKADSLHVHVLQESSVATLALDSDEESTVAAVKSGSTARAPAGHGGGRRDSKPQKRTSGRGKAASEKTEPEVSRKARLTAGLCLPHWRYGTDAHNCFEPCSWAGNGTARGK